MFIFEWDLALLSVLDEADDNVQGSLQEEHCKSKLSFLALGHFVSHRWDTSIISHINCSSFRICIICSSDTLQPPVSAQELP